MKIIKQEKNRFLKKFGKQIKKARQEADILQDELAYLAGINRTYLGRIERGISNPPIFTVFKIKKAINNQNATANLI